MDVHNNARLTPRGREAMVRAVTQDGLTPAAAARRYHTTAKTVAKWVARFVAPRSAEENRPQSPAAQA